MFFGVRSLCLLRCWECGSCVVMLSAVCGMVGGGKRISHFLFGVGLDLWMCGGNFSGREGVSLWVRCSLLVMVRCVSSMVASRIC